MVGAPGIAGGEVAHRTDAAAVTGALRLTAVAVGAAPPGAPARTDHVPGPVTSPWPSPSRVPAAFLPPLSARRLLPVAGPLAALAACAAAVVAVVAVMAARPPVPADPPRPEARATGLLAQYGYALDVPPGWAHTGGLPERRRSLLTREGAPNGSDLVAVERTMLGYDAAAEPQRVREELRAEFGAAVAAGEPLSDFDPDDRVAGRAVVSYRQDGEAGGVGDVGGVGQTTVDWYVVLDGDSQLSVGCRYTPSGADAVRDACARVVASIHRVP
ncbi:MAG TPA: type VII secretion-associated protein [Pseudonocardia sp.]|nr:type VII secretion-associated protein [Pseudonocardia sp.]